MMPARINEPCSSLHALRSHQLMKTNCHRDIRQNYVCIDIPGAAQGNSVRRTLGSMVNGDNGVTRYNATRGQRHVRSIPARASVLGTPRKVS